MAKIPRFCQSKPSLDLLDDLLDDLLVDLHVDLLDEKDLTK